jgi:hypothetical protein
LRSEQNLTKSIASIFPLLAKECDGLSSCPKLSAYSKVICRYCDLGGLAFASELVEKDGCLL